MNTHELSCDVNLQGILQTRELIKNDSPLSYATTYTKTMTLKMMTRQINYSLHEYDLQGL